MPKSALPDSIGRLLAAPKLRALTENLRENRSVSCSGLWGSSVALAVAAIARNLNRQVLIVCGHLDETDDLVADLELFDVAGAEVLPALELAGSLGRVSEEQVANRLKLVSSLGAKTRPPVVIAPIHAVMQALPSPEELKSLIREVRKGMTLEQEKLIVWLADHGYSRLDQIEVPGDFAVRGGIVDIYLPGDFPEQEDQVGLPVRIDFFDDQVDSIRTINLETLGSQRTLKEIQILDIRGQVASVDSSVSVFDYLASDAIVVYCSPLEIQEQARAYLDRLPEQRGVYPLNAVLRHGERFVRVELSQFGQGEFSRVKAAPFDSDYVPINLAIQSLQRFETEPKKALAELAELAESHEVVVFCHNEGETQRFAELLDQDVPGVRSKLTLAIGYLHRGFVIDISHLDELAPARPIALVGHHELFHRYETRRRVKKVIASRPVDSFLDLQVGDYVVHVAHGIAKFTGMHTINRDGQNEEYLTLRFADNAALHVPASRINLVQKYIGGFSGHPHLSKLGSGAWERQKARVSEAVMDMASELIEIQSRRNAQPGVAYPPDTEWQKEFEAEFPYDPTPDQITCAEEIKQDMRKTRPMDRLLCGDVGYGKTELAMRGAFKAIEFGKQVAVLVPTTVLAEQHYRSFRERMASYPFRIESISRWKSAKQQRETVKALSAGEIDVIIGTHRLLSKDVKFADLGLVVVDEEQRFGVTHKERLKQLRATVDVLTMSATPIPRTLHMSMLGIRDISSLTTAPQDRRSIVTEVMNYDEQRIKMAILRELNREGQVYFVHNRVNNILEIAEKIQSLVPDAKILVGHGQMKEGELEDVMLRFVRHEADILVCTTIIESGLDIPNVNTIFINQADRFGLSELHQLRGRVGRYKHRAYCYLILPPDRPVTPIAAKRLKAIEEYSHLGSGFKIAMRDLELRGAGNILGAEQSGHIAAVGYEMYCQLLEEAVRQLKNERKPVTPDAHVDIGISAFIPRSFIPADRQRMDIYRRLSRCATVEMLGELSRDVEDAFGKVPRQVEVLFGLTELRLLAGIFGIDSIIRKEPDVVLTVRDASRAQVALIGAPGTLRVIDDRTVYLRMPPTFLDPEACLLVIRNLLKQAYDRENRGEAHPIEKVPPPQRSATGKR